MKSPVSKLAVLAPVAACLISCVADADADAATRIVAVAPLHAAGNEPALSTLAVSITDVVTSLLAEDRATTVVERKKIDDVLAEQKLQAGGLVDAATAGRIGQLLGADLILTGSLVPEGDALHLVIKVVAVAGNEVRGTVDLKLARNRIAEDLLASGPRLYELVEVKITPPTPDQLDDSPIGRMHLLRGIGCYTARLPDQAIVHLLRAIRIDPRLVEARLWIARSYLDAGEPEKAKLELARLREHSAADKWKTEIEQLTKSIAAPK